MNKNYTLKELADIGAKAANSCLPDGVRMCVLSGAPPHHVVAREAFTKAILDAIGYELPKDEEREAFYAWSNAYCKDATTDHQIPMFEAWKAGRELLRKEVCSDQCRDTKTEPAWVHWSGGSESPIVGLRTKFEVEYRDGGKFIYHKDYLRWSHGGVLSDIIAYRILEP